MATKTDKKNAIRQGIADQESTGINLSMLECKVRSKIQTLCTIRRMNLSILECKGSSPAGSSLNRTSDMNLSRLECKIHFLQYISKPIILL